MENIVSTINVHGSDIDLEEVACNLCGSVKSKLAFKMKDERYDGDDYLYSVVECTQCGLGYTNPRPTFRTIGACYPKEFFGSSESDDRFNLKFNKELSYLKGLRGNLLDIGCRNGGFPAFSQKHGFRGWGLEVADNAENLFGLTIFNDFTEAPSDFFDVVTSWAVFEHLHDPMSYFSHVRRVLKPGGSFVFLVPNYASPRSRLMKFEDVPRHLYFYSAKTLEAYLSLQGFENVKIFPDKDVYYGGHRKFLNYLALRAIGVDFCKRHKINPLTAYKQGDMSMLEMLYLLPFEHLDRLLHKSISYIFSSVGRHGSIVIRAVKA